MKYTEFERLVHTLKSCKEKMNKYYNVLNIDEVWDDHNKAISFLLEQVYEPDAVAYILNEWLEGNNSPMYHKSDEGVTIITPLNSLKDVWRAMETFRSKDDTK